MNLETLVGLFREKGNFEEFCISQSLDFTSEVIEIYMKKPFDLESQLYFFEIEKTEGQSEYIYNHEAYHNLFDFYYFQDFLEDSPKEFTNKEIAERILSYAVNDA